MPMGVLFLNQIKLLQRLLHMEVMDGIPKPMEELIELKEEMTALDRYAGSWDFDLLEEIIERKKMEFGDVLVTLVILAEQLGVKWDECLEKAYNKISKRKGKVINGIFVKEEDLKD